MTISMYQYPSKNYEMKKILLNLLMISLVACSSRSKDETSKGEEQQQKDSISLNTFTVIPDEIDGCSCYFYLSKLDEKKGNYILVNDFASTAFIYINNKLEKFQLKDHKENSTNYFYSNSLYDLKIEITKKERSGNESSMIKGVIKVTKDKSSIQKPFVGSCGC
jgi:hypothetical protein